MLKYIVNINKYPSYFCQLIWLLFVPIYLILKGVNFKKNVICQGFPIISKSEGSEIIIGNNVILCSSSSFTALGVNHPVILRTLVNDAIIKIDDNTGVSGATICASKKITIGKGVLLGANVIIVDTDFHSIDPCARYSDIHLLENKEVIIEDNVFIGTNCIILKGSIIGKNSVIGAGSVVCGTIPMNSIAAGNPAKVLREL